MGERQLLGEVEQLVLLAILRIGEGTYAVPIREEILKHAEVDLSRGTIYVTLDRLERKGYIRSWFADPTPEPGGKSRRCVAIERDGVMALRAAQRIVDRLSAGTQLAPRKGK
jgi:PadR family transcriptional regulator, regulatory protein PadR